VGLLLKLIVTFEATLEEGNLVVGSRMLCRISYYV
jgi:hypothetical protein